MDRIPGSYNFSTNVYCCDRICKSLKGGSNYERQGREGRIVQGEIGGG